MTKDIKQQNNKDWVMDAMNYQNETFLKLPDPEMLAIYVVLRVQH